MSLTSKITKPFPHSCAFCITLFKVFVHRNLIFAQNIVSMGVYGEIWFTVYIQAGFEYLIVLTLLKIVLLCFIVVIVKLCGK